MTRSITIKKDEVAAAIDFVRSFLDECKVKDKDRVKTLLMAEEVTTFLVAKSEKLLDAEVYNAVGND